MENNEVKPIDKLWIQEALDECKDKDYDSDLESLKLEENEVVEIDVLFNKPFEEWISPENKKIKIIPVIHAGIKKNFWLNVRNPIYKEILEGGKAGRTKYRVLRTGKNENTKYIILK